SVQKSPVAAATSNSPASRGSGSSAGSSGSSSGSGTGSGAGSSHTESSAVVTSMLAEVWVYGIVGLEKMEDASPRGPNQVCGSSPPPPSPLIVTGTPSSPLGNCSMSNR